MIGVAGLKFTGGTPSTAEIRYAVFPREDQAKQFAMVFSQGVNSSGQQKLFFPFIPDAVCKATPQLQLCGIGSGNVFVMAIARGVVTANTHERQVIRGVSAGNLS